MAGVTKMFHAGAWREITDIWVKQGGTWRSMDTVEIKSGGSWREVFTSVIPGLITTITRGQNVITTTWSWWWGTSEYSAFGWDGGNDYWNSANFGSIGNATYVDGISVSRTISSCYWTHFNFFDMHYTVGGVPNTDATMTSVIANGVTFLRSGIGGYNADINGGSVFWWNRNSGVFSAGSNDFEITVT